MAIPTIPTIRRKFRQFSGHTGYVERLDFPVAKRLVPCEAMTVENYAARFTSYLKVEYSGTYTFYTLSGDGSALYIDGKRVVDNDGFHGKREASADLSMDRGFYKFEVWKAVLKIVVIWNRS